jgi:hypothetical protein
VLKLDFTIPIRTPTFNELLRMHFRVRAKSLKAIAWEIKIAAQVPPQPFQRARVTIHRYTTGTLDQDGRQGIAKGILDVLQPCSKRHPMGLGFIVGDDPDHLELFVYTIKSTAKATRIVIEELA